MKTKSLFSLMLGMLLVLGACKEKQDFVPLDVENVDSEAAYLRLDVSERSFNAKGGTFTVQVESNKSWSVSCDQSWVTLSTTSGMGNGSFSVQIAANESSTVDNATITVTTAMGNVTQTVAISRAANMSSENPYTISGHKYVDLGLPSGTLWATCNVGADSLPGDDGIAFAWGEVQHKYCGGENRPYGEWSTYRYGESSNQLTKYCSDSSKGLNGYTDNKMVLDAEDDAATVNWGPGWRTPTADEIKELINKCTSAWTTGAARNGWTIHGRLFTGPNGNTMFLPTWRIYNPTTYSGQLNTNKYCYYWSSSLYADKPSCAYVLSFTSGYVELTHTSRFWGIYVRPVVNR